MIEQYLIEIDIVYIFDIPKEYKFIVFVKDDLSEYFEE